KSTLRDPNAFVNANTICKINSDIVCTESRAVGGTQQLHPLEAACRKLQEGVDTRPVNLYKEREQQKFMNGDKASNMITAQIWKKYTKHGKL
ncbi:unnamed protein product, partial [Staurois parvus]